MKISPAISISKKCHSHQRFQAWEGFDKPLLALRYIGPHAKTGRRPLELRANASKEIRISVPWPFSVQFHLSVMSDSLPPHGLQHTRPACSSPSPGACSNSSPFSQWCHPMISSSVFPFSCCLQSFPASASIPKCLFFSSGGQSIGVSASVSVLPMNIQDWLPLGLAGWISCSPRDSQESSPTPQFKSINFSALSFLYSPTLTSIHDYWKNHSLD